MGQTLSFAATYELKLTPSLFTYDNKTETDTQVDIADDNVDKISAYVSSSSFKTDIAKITKVSLNVSESVYLTFDPSGIKYDVNDNAVIVTGKWSHGTKQTKKSIKRAKPATSGGAAKRGIVSADDGASDNNNNNNNNNKDDVGSDDDLDIKVSDVLAEIKNKLHREAYLETEISKQAHLFICFSEDIDMGKV